MSNYVFKGKDFAGNPNYTLVVGDCYRCGGTGRFAHFGVCFNCGGVRKVGSYEPTPEWAATLAARRRVKAERETRKAAAKRVEIGKAYPWIFGVAVVLGLTPCSDRGTEIAWDVFCKFLSGKVKSLSDKQAAVLFRVAMRTAARVAKDAAEAAEPKTPVVVGKGVVVEGTVLSVQERPGYGYGATVLKMLVKDDRGFKLWGTVPRDLIVEGVDRGMRVKYTANVEASKDDESFGFAARPRKASVVS